MSKFIYVSTDAVKVKDSFKLQKSIIGNGYYSLQGISDECVKEFNIYTNCLAIVDDSQHLSDSFKIVEPVSCSLFLRREELRIAPVFCVDVSERYDGKFKINSVMSCFSSISELEDLSEFIKNSSFSDIVELECRRDKWGNSFHTVSLYLDLYDNTDMLEEIYGGLVINAKQCASMVNVIKKVNTMLGDYRLNLAEKNAEDYYNTSSKRDMVIM